MVSAYTSFHYINKIKVGSPLSEKMEKGMDRDRKRVNIERSKRGERMVKRVHANEKFALTCKVKVN